MEADVERGAEQGGGDEAAQVAESICEVPAEPSAPGDGEGAKTGEMGRSELRVSDAECEADDADGQGAPQCRGEGGARTASRGQATAHGYSEWRCGGVRVSAFDLRPEKRKIPWLGNTNCEETHYALIGSCDFELR